MAIDIKLVKKDGFTAGFEHVANRITRAAGKQIRIAEEPKKTTGAVKDLMEVLKQSLNAPGKKRA